MNEVRILVVDDEENVRYVAVAVGKLPSTSASTSAPNTMRFARSASRNLSPIMK